MARKKISTGVDTPPGVIDLDDDDEIVKTVTTETRVGRQKRRTPSESVPPAVAGGDFEPELDDEDAIEAEFVEDVPQYPDNSIAAFLYGDDSLSEMTSEACTVYIRRKADTMGDNFRKPNPTESKLPKLHIGNILETTKEDIEDRVRKESGSGGHYFFQIFRNGRLGKSWESTLSDPFTVAAVDLFPAPTQPAAAVPPTPPVTVDPLDNLLAGAEKFAKLKEMFGGGSDVEKVRLEFQIAELRREIEEAKAVPQERKSERLTLLETALAANSPDLQTKILNNIFPNEDPKDRHWLADVLDVALTHKEELLAIGGPLIMSLLGGGQQQPQPNVAQLLQQQHVPPPVPPPTIPPPAERPFGHLFETPPEPADTEPNTETDEAAIEVVEETSDEQS